MHTKNIEQPADIKDFLSNFSQDPKGFVVLAGMNGTGKTYASRAVYNDFSPDVSSLEFDDKVFISQTMLNTKWQETMKKFSCSLYLLKQLIYPKMLILDDIGTRKPSESFLDFLYAVVDHRYEDRSQKGTIITTNLNSKDMREIFGDAFVSRIGSGRAFRFDGNDRRIQSF